MADVTTTVTAARQQDNVTYLDVSFTLAAVTYAGKSVTIPTGSTTAEAEALLAAAAQEWYTNEKWFDDLVLLVGGVYVVPVT